MTLPDWDFTNLEELIESRGDQVIHAIGITCPRCRREDAYASTIHNKDGEVGNPYNGNPRCISCGGLGWAYRDQQLIQGLITSVQTGPNKELISAGYANPGDAVFSPSLRARTISDFDRITMLYPAPVGDGQSITRGAATTDYNKALDTGLADDEDRLWYIPNCVYVCEDENGVTYHQGVDFVLDEKILRWVGVRPADGLTYTVKYDGFLEWIVYNTPMTRFDVARGLGQKVMLKKAHAAYMNAHTVDTPSKREEQEEAYTTRTII